MTAVDNEIVSLNVSATINLYLAVIFPSNKIYFKLFNGADISCLS
jgi:hypothetical protein